MECFLNNFQIFYFFYYIFLFIIINHYIRVSDVVQATSYAPSYATFLIERYYAYPNIVYVNLPEAAEVWFELFAENSTLVQVQAGPFFHVSVNGTNHINDLYRFELFLGMESQINECHTIHYHNPTIRKYFEPKDVKYIANNYFVEDPDNPLASEYYEKLKKKWAK